MSFPPCEAKNISAAEAGGLYKKEKAKALAALTFFVRSGLAKAAFAAVEPRRVGAAERFFAGAD